MKSSIKDNAEIKAKVQKGLDLAFQKLLKSKLQNDGFIALSDNGIIRKVRASELQFK